MSQLLNLKIWGILSITLGLAPFGAPHVLGKIKWVLGGANGMEVMDWLDLFLHGIPWLLFIVSLTYFFIKRNSSTID